MARGVDTGSGVAWAGRLIVSALSQRILSAGWAPHRYKELHAACDESNRDRRALSRRALLVRADPAQFALRLPCVSPGKDGGIAAEKIRTRLTGLLSC